MFGIADYWAFVIAVVVFLAIPGPGNLAIVFYMAFFPLFVDPARHRGLVTFGAMALTIACLTLLYCVPVILITHFAAERVRASPRVAGWLNKVAGTLLVGFGVKLAIGR